jgi:adenosylhomocysteine nucleosidase
MARGKIGLVAAMQDEIRPFLKQLNKYDKSMLHGFPLYLFTVAGNDCSLIESGIGAERAERATEVLLKSIHPALLISFGFGGAVLPGSFVGDVSVAMRSLLYSENAVSSEDIIELPGSSKAGRIMSRICESSGCRIMRSDFISSDVILNKKTLRGNLPDDITNPVLDMETWTIARIAGKEKISFLAIRTISDAAEEELEFSLDQFVDSEMNIKIGRILRAIARKPRMIPQLFRLAKNVNIAGRNLAVALKCLLTSEEISSGPTNLVAE